MEKELEFRGISLTQLELYLEELGANRLTTSLPLKYEGEGWSATILREKEISFTSVFKVNSVNILFQADGEELLSELVQRYRKKTFRAGG